MNQTRKTLDEFSKPLEVVVNPLTTIFTLSRRDSKKGRLWVPLYDQRYPLQFDVQFVYVSKFFEKDNVSGNHYHQVKEEILIPLSGSFEFTIEDIETKKREQFVINSKENKAVYVRTKLSHKIISLDGSGVLLVLASVPSKIEDEIEYVIE